jgi:hypothetical protein
VLATAICGLSLEQATISLWARAQVGHFVQRCAPPQASSGNSA